MNDMTRKVRDLHFNDDVLTSAFDYTGKNGIVVDNSTREICADYAEMPFALPTDVEAVQENVDTISTSLSDYALSDDVASALSACALSSDVKSSLSDYALSDDVKSTTEELSNKSKALSDDVESIASELSGRDEALSNWASDTFVDRSSNQEISGYKAFKDGLDVGERIKDVGNNCFAVGNDLTVGSYNFFYKGIDIYDDGHALVYLTTEQPRYPFPFVIYNGDKNNFKILGNVVTVSDTSTYSALSTGTNLSRIWNCTLDPNPEHITNANHVWRADYN